MREKKTYFLMTLGAFFWAGAFIAGKYGVNEFSPVSLTFFRFFFASIIMFFIMIKFEKKDWKLKFKDLGIMLLLGLVGMVGYHILFFTALKYTLASKASMLAAMNPLITTILASIFLNEKLGFKRLGIIFLALFGVILTISDWNINILINFDFNIGDIIMLLAVSCWAIYSVIVKKVMPRYSPLILTTYSFIVCTLILLPFVLKENLVNIVANVTYKGWSSVIYMAIFPTVIGYLIQQISIKRIGASKTSIFINLVPVFSIVLAALILKEKINLLNIISASFIVSAVYLNSKVRYKN